MEEHIHLELTDRSNLATLFAQVAQEKSAAWWSDWSKYACVAEAPNFIG